MRRGSNYNLTKQEIKKQECRAAFTFTSSSHPSEKWKKKSLKSKEIGPKPIVLLHWRSAKTEFLNPITTLGSFSNAESSPVMMVSISLKDLGPGLKSAPRTRSVSLQRLWKDLLTRVKRIVWTNSEIASHV